MGRRVDQSGVFEGGNCGMREYVIVAAFFFFSIVSKKPSTVFLAATAADSRSSADLAGPLPRHATLPFPCRATSSSPVTISVFPLPFSPSLFITGPPAPLPLIARPPWSFLASLLASHRLAFLPRSAFPPSAVDKQSVRRLLSRVGGGKFLFQGQVVEERPSDRGRGERDRMEGDAVPSWGGEEGGGEGEGGARLVSENPQVE